MRGPTAGHQAFELKYIHSFFWPPIVQIVPCAGLSTHAVFSDKAKPGGGGPVRCVWRLDYAELHTEGGIWRCFSWQITAGPLRVLCLPSSSRASLTELLPCWLATLETPPGLTELSVRDGRKIRREMGEVKQRIEEEREKDEQWLWEEHTAVGWSLLVKCTLNNTKSSLSFFALFFVPAVQLYNVQFFQCSEDCYCQVSTSIYLIVFISPLPHQSHWCVCGWVFSGTKPWQASSVWLPSPTLAICRSHTVHWLPIMMSWRREAEGEMRWWLLLLFESR